jgi:glucose-6-phosphate isomerase
MDFIYQNSSIIDEKTISKEAKKLANYLEYLASVSKSGGYEFPESSINLPFDASTFKSVMEMKKEKAAKALKCVIVVGIGGSNLGTKAVYDALCGYKDIFEQKKTTKLIFADTNDPEFIAAMTTYLENEIKKPEEVLVNVISKSGGTTETAVNFEIIFNVLQKKFKNAAERVVVTTEEHSKMWSAAQEMNISMLTMPKIVGGRYSVFSAVGLFPLAACGLDVEALLRGAAQMRRACLSQDVFKNPAALSAIILFHNASQGYKINDNFFFHPELESLGKWYRQLMGESIGKEKDIDGNNVYSGITPTVSIGSTDLHSMGQLYLGGPKDKFTTFVYTKNSVDAAIPKPLFFEGLVENIEGKKAKKIMDAVYSGVKIAYGKANLPFAEVLLADVSEGAIGKFMQFKMIEMMMLGSLMRVNPFDQPNVESYKTETKNILKYS